MFSTVPIVSYVFYPALSPDKRTESSILHFKIFLSPDYSDLKGLTQIKILWHQNRIVLNISFHSSSLF